jgi:para-aminobenzoate synthetase component 1
VSGAEPIVQRLEHPGEPADAAAAMLALPYPLFLDSASGSPGGEPHQLGRYSFVMADPVLVVRSKGHVTEVGQAGVWRQVEGDALGVVREALRAWNGLPVPGLPPFQGGAAGYIGYDYGAVLERVPPTRYDDLGVPDVVLGLYDWVLAWDHRSREAWLISTGLGAGGAQDPARARDRAALVRDRLSGGAAGCPPPRPAVGPGAPAPSYPVTALDRAPEGLR